MCDRGLVHVDVEVDSQILVQVLNRKVEVPWGVLYEVREIWRLLDTIVAQIMHTYRENNQAAGFLANWSCKRMHSGIFDRFSEFPHGLKGIVRVDRLGIPNFRCMKY